MERGSVTAGRFKAAFAAADGNDGDWARIAKTLMEELGDLPQGANLGFLYATDILADDLGSILTFLRERSGIEHWVGTIGIGIVGNGVEF